MSLTRRSQNVVKQALNVKVHIVHKRAPLSQKTKEMYIWKEQCLFWDEKKYFSCDIIFSLTVMDIGQELFYKCVSNFTNKLVKQLLSMTVYCIFKVKEFARLKNYVKNSLFLRISLSCFVISFCAPRNWPPPSLFWVLGMIAFILFEYR